MAMTSRLENMRGSHGDLGSLRTLFECKCSKPEATSDDSAPRSPFGHFELSHEDILTIQCWR